DVLLRADEFGAAVDAGQLLVVAGDDDSQVCDALVEGHANLPAVFAFGAEVLRDRLPERLKGVGRADGRRAGRAGQHLVLLSSGVAGPGLATCQPRGSGGLRASRRASPLRASRVLRC